MTYTYAQIGLIIVEISTKEYHTVVGKLIAEKPFESKNKYLDLLNILSISDLLISKEKQIKDFFLSVK